MPLDILHFRDEEKLKVVRESQRRRYKKMEDVDAVIASDVKWRNLQFELEQKRKEKNKISKEVGEVKKNKGDATELVAKSKKLDEDMAQLEKDAAAQLIETNKLLNKIGNLVHDSVPVSNDEAKNAVVATWGECKHKDTDLPHHVLMHKIHGYEPERGTVVAGHRGYFLRGVGVMLNQALINYGIAFLSKRKYTPLQPPFFMKRDIMAETAQLEDFDEQLYKVSGKTEEGEQDYYLIATSEQPISAFHREEWIKPEELPYKYAGISSCFRKEAGSHGRDTWGIFRIHQFEKVEQFVITAPDKSWEMHEEMIKQAQEFYQSLGLPYRVVNIVSGELNNAAARKYDLEAWFPGLNAYRELVSASNCTDYQARAMETRYGQKKQGEREKVYVHMLNATLTATERTICCILENYQTPEGINIPEVLQPFMGGEKFIPFVPGREEKKETDAKAAGQQGAAKDGGKKKEGGGKKEGGDKGKGNKDAAPAAAAAAAAGK